MTTGAEPTAGELRIRQLLRAESPRPRYGALLVLVASLGAFALASGELKDPRSLAVLVGVLLFHELGHWVGMRAFGYRDVRMFFIPFFGAAVSGNPHGVSATKRAIVLLLGPVPGLVAAAVIAFSVRPGSKDTMGTVVTSLAILNGMNLFPFEPFDGGRLAHVLVASRYRWLDVASLALGAAGLAWLATRLHSTPLGVLSVLSAMSVPRRWASARTAQDIRKIGPLPDAVEDAPDGALVDLEKAARQRLRQGAMSDDTYERAIVAWCRETYERATAAAPRLGVALGLGAAAFIALGLGLAAMVVVVRPRPGVVEPLTQTASSADGHVRAHFPASFRVVPTSSLSQVSISRAVGTGAELITFRTTEGVQVDGLDPSMLDAIEARLDATSQPGAEPSSVSSPSRCHNGQGRSWTTTLTGEKGTTFKSIRCGFALAQRRATYSVTLSPELYEKEAPLLLSIAEAAEFAP